MKPLTPSQERLLALMQELDGIEDSPGTSSVYVDKRSLPALERAGLAYREQVGRTWRVYLTDAGRAYDVENNRPGGEPR